MMWNRSRQPQNRTSEHLRLGRRQTGIAAATAATAIALPYACLLNRVSGHVYSFCIDADQSRSSLPRKLPELFYPHRLARAEPCQRESVFIKHGGANRGFPKLDLSIAEERRSGMDHSVEQVRDKGAGAPPGDGSANKAVEKNGTRPRTRVKKNTKLEQPPAQDARRPDNGSHSDDGSRPNKDSRSENTPPPQKDAGDQKTGFFRRPVVLVGGAVILLVAIGAAILWWLNARNYEDTDDAFIDARVVRVASQIAGQITRVDVDDNQEVREGQELIEVNPANARSRLAQATAQVAQAETAVGQARAQINSTEASYQEALAAASGAQAQAQNAQRELARYRALVAINPQAAAQSQIDQAETLAHNSAAQANAAVKQAQGIAAQRAAAAAQLKGAQAQVAALQAQVAEANINLGYTRIVAPVAGHVAQRTAAIGTYVAPGQQMLAIVPLQIWVTANFKETQLSHMRVGQPVDISVDACPDARVRGHIDSIQRGAGQAFSILPPENATGNFVKVVQRVPVKIVLDTVPQDCPLGPGMSVEPTVKVR
jgi:membrane fusion protein (multidrug efflux system)